MNINFIDVYNRIANRFSSLGRLATLEPASEKILWPVLPGVYAIWKKENGKDEELIYVGIAGKYKRTDSTRTKLGNSTFDKRSLRWTPYRFCESELDGKYRFHFRFGPKYSSVEQQRKIMRDDNAYNFSIPYSSLRVDCFIIDESDPEYSPALLEAELLTKYLKCMGDLPVANNSL